MCALPPKATMLDATLAAPPGRQVSVFTCTIGTGASGDIRLTLPQQNSSSITSPKTAMLQFENLLSMFSKSFFCIYNVAVPFR
jgi:hypothetical protein